MTNLEIIQELYRAFREKDYDAFLHICSPDLEWIQNEGFPQGATYQGAASVVEGVFKSNDERWEKFSFRVDRYLDAGNSVIVIGAYVGHNQQTQKSLHAVAAHVYDLVDSKVCRFRMFADRK
ncbi:nuclear transport factor 2 family protein [Microcoleus sp. herbarium7]|uniref:nuclear transport factor 2 family protein n=1 Tax=Microcoleus sp. herbarium7 TaxID=3055435 RepID=UPI002FD57410